MTTKINKYPDLLKRFAFFRDNDLKRNLIFFLGVFIILVIAIDFNTEMSQEKNEIGNIVAVLTSTTNCSELSLLDKLNIDPPLLFIIFIPNQKYTHSTSTILHKVRGPPCSELADLN